MTAAEAMSGERLGRPEVAVFGKSTPMTSGGGGLPGGVGVSPCIVADPIAKGDRRGEAVGTEGE